MRISQAMAPLSFDEALFLIGCTICQQGLDNEGMSVITAYALGNGAAQYQEEARAEMRKTRAAYLATLKQKNILWEIISDKWDSRTIAMYGDSSIQQYTLKELVSSVFPTPEELYTRCVVNYMRVAGKDLMLLFFNTKITYEYMSKRIQHASNHSLGEDVVQAAYQDFVTYYTVRSLRSYKAETGNPLGALAFTFNEYYLKSSYDDAKEEANFYDIINTVGIMAENEDGLRPHLDTARVVPVTVGKGMDFTDVVDKIYRASELLYRIKARSGTYLYYDLFSRYRDMLLHEDIKELRAQFRSVCDFWDFELVDSIDYRDSRDSISQYSADRKAVTEKLRTLIDNDIPEQQMFDYYKDLVETDLKTGRNGSKGFANLTFSKSKKFRMNLTFDQQIQAVIEGTLALKKLLAYINSHNIRIHSIDYRIFRNKSLQHKCKTLEDYISLQSDLQYLVDAADGAEGDGGFMSNDAVAKHLDDLSTVELAVASKNTVKEKVDSRERLAYFKKLFYVKLVDDLPLPTLIQQLGMSAMAILNGAPADGYAELSNITTYVNCNFKIALMGGCNFYDVHKDRLSDIRIMEYADAVLSKLEGMEQLLNVNAQAYEALKARFDTDNERIVLTVASLSETFLSRLMQYVAESSIYFEDYIMSLLNKKYELWMNIDIDSFDTLYVELLECSRLYDCNYTLDKEIAFKGELKNVFIGLMERGNLISKSPVYTQRKLIAIPSKKLIEANQKILLQCESSMSKLAKNQLRSLFSFNSVGFAYQNGTLLEYRQCYVHKNGFLYNSHTEDYREISPDDLSLLMKMRS